MFEIVNLFNSFKLFFKFDFSQLSNHQIDELKLINSFLFKNLLLREFLAL